MPVLGKLLHRGLQWREALQRWRAHPSPLKQQRKVLTDLLSTARTTAFGRRYDFADLLDAADPVAAFQDRVPVFPYERMYEAWWHRTLEDEADVTWPGRIPYFAKSSGTSAGASKYIPFTDAMIAATQRAGRRQIYALPHFDLPDETFEADVLFLGGSTDLTAHGDYEVGDMSGISAAQFPNWFHSVYKPGSEIAAMSDWAKKMEAIVEKAPEWDIGIISGVPAWVQILFQKIIAHYEVDTIHDVWPNLAVYVHGGVAFGPYRRALAALVDRPLKLMETYIASEGYVAFQPAPDCGLQMLLDNGLFYEFVPFTDDNVDADGRVRDNPTALTIDEVEADTPYAVLLTTCSGAWRYLLGDVIEFTDVDAAEIEVTGRTQHFLNLCGEHLSGANMADAVERLENQFEVSIPEFTVVPESADGRFAHHWFLGMEDGPPNTALRDALDDHLKALNDDYRGEREENILHDLYVTTVPVSVFYEWMDSQDKLGAQNKFPRVLKGDVQADWQSFLQDRGVDDIVKGGHSLPRSPSE